GGHDDIADDVARVQAQQGEHRAAEDRADHADDDVPQYAEPAPLENPPGQEPGDQADEQEDDQFFEGHRVLLRPFVLGLTERRRAHSKKSAAASAFLPSIGRAGRWAKMMLEKAPPKRPLFDPPMTPFRRKTTRSCRGLSDPHCDLAFVK